MWVVKLYGIMACDIVTWSNHSSACQRTLFGMCLQYQRFSIGHSTLKIALQIPISGGGGGGLNSKLFYLQICSSKWKFQVCPPLYPIWVCCDVRNRLEVTKSHYHMLTHQNKSESKYLKYSTEKSTPMFFWIKARNISVLLAFRLEYNIFII